MFLVSSYSFRITEFQVVRDHPLKLETRNMKLETLERDTRHGFLVRRLEMEGTDE
jgi:hypothetical protein